MKKLRTILKRRRFEFETFVEIGLEINKKSHLKYNLVIEQTNMVPSDTFPRQGSINWRL